MVKIILNRPSNIHIIADSESLAHRAYHAFTNSHSKPPLRTTTGLLSGCFFGFFMMLQQQVEKFSPEDIVFTWGDRRSNLKRKQLYTEYKANRSDTPYEGFPEQIADIKLALSGLGYSQYYSPGYEGDDVIAALVKKHVSMCESMSKPYHIIILSSDKDILQLVTDKITVCAPTLTNPVEFTPERVKEKFGVTPEYISDFLTLVGDDGDNVPGVKGIGEKTASKLLSEQGHIHNWFNNIENLNITPSIKEKLLQNRETMILSKKLVSLKLNLPEVLQQISDTSSLLDPERVFDKYQMRTIRPHHFSPVRS